MHPVIMRQLAADHIRARYAKAEDERLNRQARRARRRAPSARPRPPASGTLSYDDPAWTQAQRAMHGSPAVPLRPHDQASRCEGGSLR